MSISNGAAAARRQDGKFGHQEHSEAEVGFGANIEGPVALLEAFSSETSAERLHELAGSSELLIKLAVTQNHHVVPKTLDLLATDGDVSVRLGVANNPQCSGATLDVLAKDSDPAVRREVAHSGVEKLSEDSLNALMSDSDLKVRDQLAMNTKTPPDILEMLSYDENPSVAEYVIYNPSFPQARIYEMARSGSVQARQVVGETTANQGMLMDLAQDDSRWVRESITGNPYLPLDAALLLAGGEDIGVRWQLAEQTTFPSVLDRLADDDDPLVRISVAGNPNTSSAALARLVSKDPGLGEFVLNHPNITPEVFQIIDNAS